MMNQILGGVLSASILLSTFSNVCTEKAVIEPPSGLIEGRATAYCLKGTMANGEETHEGVCASSKDRMGCLIVVYKRMPDGSVGDYIGTYVVKDQGGTKAIKNGNVIDVWQPDLEACQDYMDLLYEDGCEGKVWLQVIEGVG